MQCGLHRGGPAGHNARMPTVFVSRVLPGDALERLRAGRHVTVWQGAVLMPVRLDGPSMAHPAGG
jgi:hypothetical protein